MNKTILALAATLAITAVPAVSHAQDASPLSFNVSLTSDYRYRGISQTRLKPAIQGGVDYALPSGVYVVPGHRTSNGSKTFRAATPASRSICTAATRARFKKTSPMTSAC